MLDIPQDALKRSHTVTSFGPLTPISASADLSQGTALVATASTTFEGSLPRCLALPPRSPTIVLVGNAGDSEFDRADGPFNLPPPKGPGVLP